ncbi:unnamed protein product, partial [Amoebophrya sp. A25]|eukprot:GSA25T00026917001.1
MIVDLEAGTVARTEEPNSGDSCCGKKTVASTLDHDFDHDHLEDKNTQQDNTHTFASCSTSTAPLPSKKMGQLHTPSSSTWPSRLAW